MSTSRSDFFINRNVEIIRAVNAKIDEGIGVREAMRQVSTELEDCSYSVIDAVMFTKSYSFRAEAWAIIHKEEEEKGKLEKNNGNSMAVAGVVASA
jgi:hypothetical protein